MKFGKLKNKLVLNLYQVSRSFNDVPGPKLYCDLFGLINNYVLLLIFFSFFNLGVTFAGLIPKA